MIRHGFSLLELVIVLAIGTLLAGVAVPRMGSASARHKADFAARRVVLDFERVRDHARLTGAVQTITFDADNHRYTVTGTASGPTAGYTVKLLQAPYEAKIIDVGFAGANVATFDAFGECAAGGAVTIQIGSNTRTITLDDASGQARWK